MSVEKQSRDLTPLDLRLLEPDLLGAVALVLYGRETPARPVAHERRSFVRGGRGKVETPGGV